MSNTELRNPAFGERHGLVQSCCDVILRRVRNVSLSWSVPLFVRMEQLGSHWKDFCKIRYSSIFLKRVEKIQVSLKSDRNNGHFTWRPMYKVVQI
jgi:hypothetical protein